MLDVKAEKWGDYSNSYSLPTLLFLYSTTNLVKVEPEAEVAFIK